MYRTNVNIRRYIKCIEGNMNIILIFIFPSMHMLYNNYVQKEISISIYTTGTEGNVNIRRYSISIEGKYTVLCGHLTTTKLQPTVNHN